MTRIRGKWYERQLLNWRWWLVFPVALVTFIPATVVGTFGAAGSLAVAVGEWMESVADRTLAAMFRVLRAMRQWAFRAVDARIRARLLPGEPNG